MKRAIFAATALMLATNPASAVTMLIGDVDGFGYTNPNSYQAYNGSNPDADNDGLLEAGELLPDLNGNGTVAIGSGDSFDHRSAAEAADTNGAQWTDQSLETGGMIADNALFTFNFATPVFGDSDYGVDHFINFVFGDYDVTPAYLVVDGTTVNLSTQGGQDGLIQLAYATVAWTDMLDGQVVIDVVAPNEPYVTIDYAYLHTKASAAPVPAPAGLALLGLGLVGLLAASRRK